MWSTRVTLPHRTRRIDGAMHRDHPCDVEDIETDKTRPSWVSASSPERSYDRFSDSAESLAAAPSVFEQLSVGFDSFCGHVPLLQNSTFRTPCPNVLNVDFQFWGFICQLIIVGPYAISEDAHMSHPLGPPHGKAQIARSISLHCFDFCTSKYPAKRVSQGAPGEIAHMGILQNRV